MLPFHNMIFFHNYCPIDSTTMFTAYTQHIHTVLFAITLPSTLTLLFTYAFLFTMWYFFTITAQLTLQQCLQHILNIYIRYLFTITLPSILTLLFIYASFSQCDIFSQSLPNSLYNNVYSIYSTYTYSTVYNYTTQYTVCAFTYASFSQCDIFSNHCTIDSTTMSIAYPRHMHTVLFTITLPSRLTLLFTYASFSQYDIFSQLLPNWLYNNVYSIYSTYTYSTIYNYTTQYTNFAVYICFPFHNVIFFHNHCPIHSTTMFTAYTQHIHTVLFTITLPSRLTLLFTYASFSQYDIFAQLLHNWLYNNVYSIYSTYTYGTVYNYTTQYTRFAVYICFPFHNVIFFLNYCIIYSTTVFTAYPQHMHTVLFTITLPSRLTLLFTYASFSQYDIFSQLLPNWLYNNVYSISSTYTYGICLQLHYPVYWLCCLYMLPFHNVIFFHNHCPIHSTTMFTAYTQHIHTVLFTITLPSTLTLLFTYAFLFTMWYFFTITAQLTLQQCIQHILNIYIEYCLQLHYPVDRLCCLHMLPFHNMIFFHNYCPIDSTTMSTAYPQHIQRYLFTITLPSILTLLFIYASFSQCDIFSQSLPNSLYNNVYSIYSTYTYSTVYNYTTQYTVCAFTYASFSQCDIFSNHCTIDSTTMSIAYPRHMHTVLFTITLPSRLTLMFTYASFSQYDIFSQLLPNWLYNNVYSIYSTYTYSTIYNYTTQYTNFAVYICFPLHNVIFFHNHCPIHSTTMFTAYTQHIHTVLFTITLPSRLTLLFTYASFSQYDIFSQLLHNWLYNNVYSIYSTYTYGTVYNYTTQYTRFAVYICFPFHNVIFFLNHCIIHSTTLFTAYPQHMHTVLFTITLPSRPTLLFTYASFSQYDIFSQLLPNWLYNNVYSYPQHIHTVFVYNYTTQYTDFAVYICFLFTMWYFFTITAQFTLQQCLQHILNIYIQYCLQLHHPVYCMCFYICFLFTMWYFFTITAQLTLQQCL